MLRLFRMHLMPYIGICELFETVRPNPIVECIVSILSFSAEIKYGHRLTHVPRSHALKIMESKIISYRTGIMTQGNLVSREIAL